MANEKVPRAQDNVRDVKLESQSRPRRPSLMGRVEEILMCPESHGESAKGCAQGGAVSLLDGFLW